MGESEFRAAYVHGGETLLAFLDRPIAMVLLAGSVIFVCLPPVMERLKNRRTE
jgi:TctA family transporter